MKVTLLFILIAVLSYGLGSVNGAMILSRFIFHKDLRKYGSHNANYANFAHVFGAKWGPAVIAVDVLKTAVAVMFGGLIMLLVDRGGNYVVVGKLFAGFCTVLGHMYPIQYQLRGGRGVACCMTTLWLADWRVGLVATGVFVIVVAFSQYVSLASMAACLAGALASWLFVPPDNLKGIAGTLVLITALLIIWRHRGNVLRILAKKEPKVMWGRGQSSQRNREDKF